MGIDQPIKRKRGRPAGSRSTNSEMEEKMKLIKWRTDLLDSGAGSSESDKDDDAIPMDDEIAIVVANEPAALAIHCGDTDDDDGEVIPIEIVRPRRVGPKKRKLPGVPQTQIVRPRRVGPKKRKLPQGYDANGHHISVRESAVARAEEIQSNLPAEHPSIVKHMLRSHVVKGFWLGLPKHFCDKHLPNRDAGIVLEDENGEDHHTTYLGYKQGISAGWRGFAIDHGIKVGDVVVFELVKSTKFKVYIVRANGFTTADVDSNLQNLEARKKVGEEQSCEDVISEEDTTTNNREVPPSDGSSRNGIGISDSEIDFDDVTSFSDVNVILDCLATDCEFHDRLRRTYYELCCSQKSLLHGHLLKQLQPTLVAGVIMETVSIADGIRACKAEASSREDFLVWKKTLESFELLGMNVAFLLNRVNGLLGAASPSRESYAEWQDKYEELKLERARAGDKMKALELRLSNVKDVLQKVDSEMEELQSSLKKSDEALQELASAPW